jgi:hypothetical protein
MGAVTGLKSSQFNHQETVPFGVVSYELPLIANLFFNKEVNPIGACPAYSIGSLFLPRHFIPSPFFYEIGSLIATYITYLFEFFLMIRLLHKLGNTDRRLTRQDRLLGYLLGRGGG